MKTRPWVFVLISDIMNKAEVYGKSIRFYVISQHLGGGGGGGGTLLA